MMTGKNRLHLNEATMATAIQYWLTETQWRQDTANRVERVYWDDEGDEFVVEVLTKETQEREP